MIVFDDEEGLTASDTKESTVTIGWASLMYPIDTVATISSHMSLLLVWKYHVVVVVELEDGGLYH